MTTRGDVLPWGKVPLTLAAISAVDGPSLRTHAAPVNPALSAQATHGPGDSNAATRDASAAIAARWDGDAAHGHHRVERFDQFHPELLGNPESSTPS